MKFWRGVTQEEISDFLFQTPSSHSLPRNSRDGANRHHRAARKNTSQTSATARATNQSVCVCHWCWVCYCTGMNAILIVCFNLSTNWLHFLIYTTDMSLVCNLFSRLTTTDIGF